MKPRFAALDQCQAGINSRAGQSASLAPVLKKNSMKGRPWLVLALLLCPLLFTTDMVSAQSTDQSNPTPIAANELTIKGPKKNNQQYYYSFTGGPGEVSITLNVKAKSYSTFVGIKVFDADLNTLTYHNMSADTSSAGLARKKFDVGEKQTLVLSFNSDPSLAECKIKLEGAVEFGPLASAPVDTSSTPSPDPVPTDSSSASSVSTDTPAQTDTPVPTDNPVSIVDQGAAATEIGPGKNKAFTMSLLDAVGQRFNIPANGKLRIELKDGSVQEIDLTQVKKILIKK